MKKESSNRQADNVKVATDESKSEVSLREEAIQAFWEDKDIFNKSVQAPGGGEPKGDFVFYDGPPFATGLPHYGHILAGTIKDAIPRFWTMNGYRVRRTWGWDCHGLPIENLIEKKLGLATKRDIETYGIKKFNESARDTVLEYADDWRKIIPRMGRFVDMEHDYKTMDSTYTESVWWVFKALHDKGLVYEGFKSMHLCPRCGTTLSNFEVNQGYKDIKDISVFVEFPLVDEPNTSFLAWTTTPWTLPGNMALAVNQDFEYAVVEVSGEKGVKRLILSKERVAAVLKEKEYKIVEIRKGAELLGKKYEPPFPWLKIQIDATRPVAEIAWSKEEIEKVSRNNWTVLHADFVEVGEEGAGVVHIAPAYGEDDLNLAKKEGISIFHHVDESGHFEDFITDFAGQLVKPKDDDESDINHMDADIEVIRALAAAGKLFAKEKITHSYPHCWRCDTPLLNYATTSWFVEVTKIKDELVAANEKVKWVPNHVGTNRFGKWLAGARDWAVSRQRYWGAPLPIWKHPETGEYKVFGSLAEMQEYVPKQNNQFWITRHAESEFNIKNTLNVDRSVENGLTEKGLVQVRELADELKKTGVDFIYHSPLQRTRETAEKVAQVLGLSPEAVIEDERLLEMGFGEFEGKTVEEYHAFLGDGMGSLMKRPKGGENWIDVKQRVGEFLYEVNATHRDKNILFVSHNGTSQMIQAVATGESVEVTAKHIEQDTYDLKNAELRALSFTPMPHNDKYELDYHRPYIDDIDLFEDGVKLERVPDVFDCWFESGSMPYGQHHYPFERADIFEKEYFPAKFIAEGLDQTRGWFYSLIVLGTALFGKSPYENVIVNGLVLAEDGKKMSKSLQNYPDPMSLVNRTGADAMRWYLLSSPVIRGEDLNFSEKEVLELQRKNIGRLHNVLAMYELFADETSASADSTNVLDRWIINRLHQLIIDATAGYRGYEMDKATRPAMDFIDDLSVWYLRRSRDRLKGDDNEDKKKALSTLRYVLKNLALVMAPATPFYADHLWRVVKEDSEAESVHLAAWPAGGEVDEHNIAGMAELRRIVSEALEMRTKAGIKVRQPLSRLSFGSDVVGLDDSMLPLLADELNVKEVIKDSQGKTPVVLDTTLTPELITEGVIRELIRAIQGRRKVDCLQPKDDVSLVIDTNEKGMKAVEAHQDVLMKTVGATSLTFSSTEGEVIESGDYQFIFTIHKK